MQVKTRGRTVMFTHDDKFRGDVLIERGAANVSVPFDDLQTLADAKARHAARRPEQPARGAPRRIDVTKLA